MNCGPFVLGLLSNCVNLGGPTEGMTVLSNLAARQRSIFFVLALALLLVGISPPGSAYANVTSVSVSPASWAPGSSPAATFTLNVTGTVTSYVGFWENNGTRTWSLSTLGSHNGTLAGNVLTCATSGVTYTSALFVDWGDGLKTNVCSDDQDGSYFEIYLFAASARIVGPGTIQISLPAGFLTAPTVIGSTTFQAYAAEGFPIAKTNFDVTVATPAPQPTEEISGMQPLLQQVGMPVSGDCTNVEDSHLDWGTGLYGGWTRSWAEWINAGSGGPVCLRSFAFDPILQHWSIL